MRLKRMLRKQGKSKKQTSGAHKHEVHEAIRMFVKFRQKKERHQD